MATLTAKLTLTSSNATSDTLNLTVTDTLTTGNPAISTSRSDILHTGATNILTTSSSSITYVYLKNLDSTNLIVVKTDGGTAFADLGPEEFMFLPLKGAVGLEVQADTATCSLEYGYWTKG